MVVPKFQSPAGRFCLRTRGGRCWCCCSGAQEAAGWVLDGIPCGRVPEFKHYVHGGGSPMIASPELLLHSAKKQQQGSVSTKRPIAVVRTLCTSHPARAYSLYYKQHHYGWHSSAAAADS